MISYALVILSIIIVIFSILYKFQNDKKHSTDIEPMNIFKYINSIEHNLKPPVSNKIMYDNNLKVMIVGGPNQRTDYHIEIGEELFYQVKGSMDLDIIINHNQKQRITINEGYMFLLPAGIPHSPQRYNNSIGIVIERIRKINEIDGLRWYQDDFNDILYEEYFYCSDLGTQIKKVIENYHHWLTLSNKKKHVEYTSNQDISIIKLNEMNNNITIIDPPFLLKDVIQKSYSNNSNDSYIYLFNNEFQVKLYKYNLNQSFIINHNVDNNILLNNQTNQYIFLWQLSGSSIIQYKLLNQNQSNKHIIKSIIVNENEVIMINLFDIIGNLSLTQRNTIDALLCISNENSY